EDVNLGGTRVMVGRDNASPAQTRARRKSFLCRGRNRSDSDARQILVRLKQIRPGPLDDLKQIIHRRNFLELLGQEPLEEIDRDVVVLLSGKLHQPVDLLGDMDFLVQRKL